jgi:transposase
MNTREQRGIVIAATVKLTRTQGIWFVPSQSSCDKRYAVDPTKGSCNCPDHQETGFKCKHQYAVEFTLRRERTADGTVVEQQEFKWREEKTYTQNWPAYNAAQTTEKHRFQELLFDLCSGVSEGDRQPGRGRPKTPLADMAFATTFKVYTTLSSRRFACDLRDAQGKGYLTPSIHFNAINAFLESAELTPVLKSLIVRSAGPLRSVERDFAVDSSGFSVSRFVKWHDEKYGRERSGRDWVKVHLACGVKTNVVTAAAIYHRDAADAPVLPELVNTTAETFKVAEVSADKGYLSADNIETIFAAGGTPFIAFKQNSTGGKGGLFEKMFHYYQFNRDEYMDHYHKRSNVESTFSMVKRKFGDNVRSRTDNAMRNEVYCKLLAHNLCVVHESHVELGIEPVFWPEQNERTVMLPFKPTA